MKERIPNFILLLLIVVLFSRVHIAQTDSLKTKIVGIIERAEAKVGSAVIRMGTQDTISVNNDYCYPMQSVYKFPLALAVLNEVDKGNLFLEQKIQLTKDNLLPNTWSPLREKYPEGNVEITLAEVIENTVAWSDNNGCDILFALLGGPAVVNSYIQSLGIEGITILSTEKEMHADWTIQYKNCSSPSAMAKLLCRFAEGKILSDESTEYLWDVMVNTATGTSRLKGNLPEGTKVAHKTGSSGVSKVGLAPATNDAGIIVLPDGSKIAVVVFVSDSYAEESSREKVIADIAKAVWDNYN